MQGPPINVWVWHQSTELENLKSDDATAAATARWAGEAALRNATNTTTKGTTTTAAADVRHGPSPLSNPQPAFGYAPKSLRRAPKACQNR
jgi:hypothetical protein